MNTEKCDIDRLILFPLVIRSLLKILYKCRTLHWLIFQPPPAPWCQYFQPRTIKCPVLAATYQPNNHSLNKSYNLRISHKKGHRCSSISCSIIVDNTDFHVKCYWGVLWLNCGLYWIMIQGWSVFSWIILYRGKS